MPSRGLVKPISSHIHDSTQQKLVSILTLPQMSQYLRSRTQPSIRYRLHLLKSRRITFVKGKCCTLPPCSLARVSSQRQTRSSSSPLTLVGQSLSMDLASLNLTSSLRTALCISLTGNRFSIQKTLQSPVVKLTRSTVLSMRIETLRRKMKSKRTIQPALIGWS